MSSLPSAARNPRIPAPLIPEAVTTFLARLALGGFVVWLLALTGHA